MSTKLEMSDTLKYTFRRRKEQELRHIRVILNKELTKFDISATSQTVETWKDDFKNKVLAYTPPEGTCFYFFIRLDTETDDEVYNWAAILLVPESAEEERRNAFIAAFEQLKTEFGAEQIVHTLVANENSEMSKLLELEP